MCRTPAPPDLMENDGAACQMSSSLLQPRLPWGAVPKQDVLGVSGEDGGLQHLVFCLSSSLSELHISSGSRYSGITNIGLFFIN